MKNFFPQGHFAGYKNYKKISLWGRNMHEENKEKLIRLSLVVPMELIPKNELKADTLSKSCNGIGLRWQTKKIGNKKMRKQQWPLAAEDRCPGCDRRPDSRAGQSGSCLSRIRWARMVGRLGGWGPGRGVSSKRRADRARGRRGLAIPGVVHTSAHRLSSLLRSNPGLDFSRSVSRPWAFDDREATPTAPASRSHSAEGWLQHFHFHFYPEANEM